MSEKSGVDRSTDAWIKCEGCGMILYRKELSRHSWVCPNCTHHFRVGSPEFIAILADEGSFRPRHEELRSTDPLHFSDSKKYADRIKAADAKGGASEAVVTGMATIEGLPVAMAIMDFGYMGGSMGSVVGERIARITKDALDAECPLIILSASGGARMQEGILSLMQMAKTSAMLGRMREARLPFISILTHPTTGGVTASFATLGDIILAEPNALIGFAGPRVIRETINEDLPEGFQRSEFLMKHGMVDQVVDRREMHARLATLLALFDSARGWGTRGEEQAVETAPPVDARTAPLERGSDDGDPTAAPVVDPSVVSAPVETDDSAAEADAEIDAELDADLDKAARATPKSDAHRPLGWFGSDDAPSPGTP